MPIINKCTGSHVGLQDDQLEKKEKRSRDHKQGEGDPPRQAIQETLL